MSLLCLAIGITGATAANLTVQQPSFAPAAIRIGQSFAFSVNLSSAVTLSNAVVAMDIDDQSGHLMLQKFYAGQNFQAGQTRSYDWSSAIPAGATLSVPFTSGKYTLTVTVFNSSWTTQYAPATTAATLTVGLASTAAASTMGSIQATPNIGYTATAPILPAMGLGKTYYVSNPGNAAVDKVNRALLPPGATVYPTLQAAANVTNPGDTVEVMNGTYTADPTQWNEGVLLITRSGSAAGGFITYEAYPGHHPVVAAAGDTNLWDTIHFEASYIVLRGFEVVGSAQYVTLSYANQATAAATIALAQEAAAREPAALPSIPAKRLTNGDCIAGSDVAHIIVLNNLVHDCSAAGIDFEQSDYITVEANTVYNTSWWTMYDTSGIDIHLALNTDSSTAYKNYVLSNISYGSGNTQPFLLDIYNNDLNPGSAPSAPTDGNGIIIDTNQSTNNGSPYVGRTLVAGNIAYNNGGGGVVSYRSSHVDLINNTAYMNNTCPVAGSACGPATAVVGGVQVSGIDNGQVFSNAGNDIDIYNNILVAPTTKLIYTNWQNTSIAENDNILYSANGQIVLGGYKPAAQDITANPLFSNAAAPAQNDFLPSATAPGGYSGTSFTKDNVSTTALLGLRILNGKVDIGAGP